MFLFKWVFQEGLIKTYVSLVILTILFYGMIKIVIHKKLTIRPWFISVLMIKNALTCAGTFAYFAYQDDWPIVNQITLIKTLVPSLVYLATFGALVIQIASLFLPSIINIIDEETLKVEKENPLKRIKENLFFILFNLLHVFILVGDRHIPIIYIFAFCQIFAFFRIAAQCRLYNSLVSSVFTILTCIQYYLASGHRFDLHTFQTHESYNYNLYISRFFTYMNAFGPVVFCMWWSLTMVIKEQGDDEKIRLIIDDIK